MSLDADSRHIDKTINKLATLGSLCGRTEAVEKLHKLFSYFKKGIFRIVVIGEIKKGKSSFINALLGNSNLVPVQDDITTSTVFKLVYGKEHKIRVYLKDKDNNIIYKIINESEIAEYELKTEIHRTKKELNSLLFRAPIRYCNKD